MTLTADTLAPRAGEPFNVSLSIGLAERVERLENVYLPTFSGVDELGDERQIARTRSGTTYRETLRLVAPRAGQITVGSAYLDAIDGRDGKPKRFISNTLQFATNGAAAETETVPVAVLFLLLAAALVAAFVVLRFRRNDVPRTGAFPQQPVVRLTAPTAREIAARALQRVDAERSRAAVMEARSALWNVAGGHAGETLEDLLGRNGVAHGGMRRLLSAVECAAFIDDARLSEAIQSIVNEKEAAL